MGCSNGFSIGMVYFVKIFVKKIATSKLILKLS